MTAMDALNQARQAWQRTAMQLSIELEDGLDEVQGKHVSSVGVGGTVGPLPLVEPEGGLTHREKTAEVARVDGPGVTRRNLSLPVREPAALLPPTHPQERAGSPTRKETT